MKMRLSLRWRRSVVDVQPDPLRTREDALETGLIAGGIGSPWSGAMIKNLKDRHIATGDASETPAVHRAGVPSGKRPPAAHPPQ
jgi:hypothetical protein